jgi:hypothetical protein
MLAQKKKPLHHPVALDRFRSRYPVHEIGPIFPTRDEPILAGQAHADAAERDRPIVSRRAVADFNCFADCLVLDLRILPARTKNHGDGAPLLPLRDRPPLPGDLLCIDLAAPGP